MVATCRCSVKTTKGGFIESVFFRALKEVMFILIFIGNELLDKSKRDKLSMPLEFITYAFVEGKLYKHYNNDGTFILQHGKAWGNDVVYGAIFALKDASFYIRLLDSYHQCSLSVLMRNHSRDIHHRTEQMATPISFDSLDDFVSLKYRERSQVEVHVYTGNPNHPKINQRLNKTVSYRISSGVDKHFTKLFREESS